MININVNINPLKIYDRIKEKFTPTVCSRFLQLFEAHGIGINQIPSFFGHGLTVEDMANKKRLLRKLDETSLNAACKTFGVRREWLDCADDQVYDVHHFRAEHDNFMLFLDQLKIAGNSLKGHLYLSSSREWELDSLFVISEEIGHIGEMSIHRYHLCGGWIHKYWKDRPDITHCVASILKRGAPYLHGHWVENSLKRFCSGLELPNAIETLKPDRKKSKKEHWHPDHWLFDPQDFVDGILDLNLSKADAYANALSLWLELYRKGALENGYTRSIPIKEFEALFKRYT